MKYRNASEVLPDDLLKELQKYAPGEILYVPSGNLRKKWGADTGARRFYEERNEEIRRKFFVMKVKIDTLCEEYSLSDETVKKILYR
ncbi:MAG: hypothetical protein LBS21_03370 [Clostridiales bacterium]|jgi:hypothetical protein|nr:hypothetical protein [Clostridiales bacterium]